MERYLRRGEGGERGWVRGREGEGGCQRKGMVGGVGSRGDGVCKVSVEMEVFKLFMYGSMQGSMVSSRLP
jgi:hypothetical protein